jgi:hypothetical protein
VKVSPGAAGKRDDGREQAREAAEAQGGRISGDAGDSELELILPRR